MKKNMIISIFALFALAACNQGGDMTPYEYAGYDYDYDNNVVFYQDNAPVRTSNVANTAATADAGTSMIKYSVPADGDLTLETAHHVIQIQGNPNQSYTYYVWAGGKDYVEDPDLIVEDGTAAVLTIKE